MPNIVTIEAATTWRTLFTTLGCEHIGNRWKLNKTTNGCGKFSYLLSTRIPGPNLWTESSGENSVCRDDFVIAHPLKG